LTNSNKEQANPNCQNKTQIFDFNTFGPPEADYQRNKSEDEFDHEYFGIGKTHKTKLPIGFSFMRI
jgi:hypothetical protein